MSQYFRHRGNVLLKAPAFVSNFAEREQEQKVINRQQQCAAMVHYVIVLLSSTMCYIRFVLLWSTRNCN